MANHAEIVNGLRRVFLSGKTKTYEWRRGQLTALLKLLEENRDAIADALKKDLGKSKFESCVFEVDYCRNDLVTCLNNLSDWMKPEKVKKNIINLMDKAYIRSEPYGVAFVIGAWNYPIQITILPVLGAIAAGNCVVLKPSEVSWETAKLLQELFDKYMDRECIRCVNGGIPETSDLLKQKWDYIFYTGNSVVGKIVMRAACEYLTPVTLELGGKSPVYVDKNCDLSVVAQRIIWGKAANSGQTCVAPDYILCTREVQDALVENMKVTLSRFYPDGIEKSRDYPRMINDRHFQRVAKVLEKSRNKVAVGGETNADDKFIGITVLTNVSPSDAVMQEEIFGPLLPIVPIRDELEAIDFIRNGEKPLALYIFSNNQDLIDNFSESCTSGGLCINDVLMQAGLPTLPFGGVGNSGMGSYHGKFSFDTFSHKRSVMHRGLNMESVNKIRYPPFSDKKLNLVSKLQGKKLRKGGVASLIPYFLFGTLFAVLFKILADRMLF